VRKVLPHIFGACLLICLAAVGAARAQDFQKTYRVGAGDSLSIESVAGDVRVVGYDGDVVAVAGFKEGRDPAKVEVVDKSGAGGVRLSVAYAPHYRGDAAVRFEVRVPRALRLRIDAISTASGNVRVDGVACDVRVSSSSGNIEVRDVSGDVRVGAASGDLRLSQIAGAVSAETASGSVNAEVARSEGVPSMVFSSASGNVNVKLATGLDATIKMSSSSGTISTDFPFRIDKDRDSGSQSARGELGRGTLRLRLSSESGHVRLTRL
jgi:hypothetical protein